MIDDILFFLSTGYHAPLDLYPEFHRIIKDPTLNSVPEGRPVSVCVGKEWYRFPSSFLLPNKSVSNIHIVHTRANKYGKCPSISHINTMGWFNTVDDRN